MSDAPNTLKPAIREAIDGALKSQKIAPCEVCSKEPARTFAFAYAKAVETTSKQTTTGRIDVTTYSPIKAFVVHLCDDCLTSYKKPIQRKYLTQIIVSGLAALLLIILGLLLPGWREILLFGALIPGIVLLQGEIQYRLLSTNARRTGSMKALGLHEEELRQQGFDSFWADVPD